MSSKRQAMKIGVDGRKLPEGDTPGAIGRLQHAAGLGLDGVFFRSLLEISPTLDVAELADARSCADDLGLYLEAGVGKVNPFANAEMPEIRELGGGDYRRGMEMMIAAGAAIGMHDLWTGTANYKYGLPDYFVFDRFRTDVTWTDQLAATAKFLKTLAPVLREHGSHLNLETHEEITSFELVRIVEEVGDDVVGITFDVGNVMVRAEDPVLVAERVMPYTRMSHVKDAGLYFTEYGLGLQPVPCGEGVVDWHGVLAVFLRERPDIHLSIENPQTRFEMPMHIHDQVWLDAHPDLTVPEFSSIMRLAAEHRARIDSGELPGRSEVFESPCEIPDQLDYITRSADYLRNVLTDLQEAPR